MKKMNMKKGTAFLLSLILLFCSVPLTAQAEEVCAHASYDNGFCVSCGAYQPAEKNSHDVYAIGNAGQLYWFAELTKSDAVHDDNGTPDDPTDDIHCNDVSAELTADIVVNPGLFQPGGQYVPQNGEICREWTPIAYKTVYGGVFEGNGYTVSGLYCKTDSNAGLFDTVSGIVQNVNIENSYFEGNVYAGSIAARVISEIGLSQGAIVNCINNKRIDTSSNKNSSSVVVDSTNAEASGGIVGYAENAIVRSCTNKGFVAASGGVVGGIVGRTQNALVEYCTSRSEDVSGSSSRVGGIVGELNVSKDKMYGISFCRNFSKVTGECAGGLVGYLSGSKSSGSVVFSYSAGSVSTRSMESSLGGLIGYASKESEDEPYTTCCFDKDFFTVSLVPHAVGNFPTYHPVDPVLEDIGTDDFASGKVAYEINRLKGKSVWKQKLGTDTYPEFEGPDVYYGYLSCAEDSSGQKGYTNNKNPLHTPVYTASGATLSCTCDVCGKPLGAFELQASANLSFDGTEKPVSVTGSVTTSTGTDDANGKVDPPAVTYINAETGEVPILPGKYTAQIILGNAQAELPFEITATPAEVSGTWGENGWYTSAKLLAPDGFTVTLDPYKESAASVTIPDGIYENGLTYYLVASNGILAGMNTAPLKVDSWLDSVVEVNTKDKSAFVEITMRNSFSGEADLSGIDEKASLVEWVIEPNTGASIGEYGTGKNFEGNDIKGFPITGLVPSTEYRIRVHVKDMAGNIHYQNADFTTRIEHTAPVALNPEYNGAEQKLVSPATAVGGTPMYRLSENESWSKEIPSATDIGEYTVHYYIPSDEPGMDIDPSFITARIEKRTPTPADFVLSADSGLVYDGSVHLPTVIPHPGSTGMGEVTVKIYDENGALSDAPVDAGTYTVKLDVKEGETYKAVSGLTHESWRFTVERREVTVHVPTCSKTYGEDDPSLDYTVEGVLDGDEFRGVLSREPGEDVGHYGILPGTVTEENNPNYKLNFSHLEGLFEIAQREAYAKAKPQTVKYGEAIDPDAYEITGLLPGHTATAELAQSTHNVTKDGTVILFNVKISDADGADITDNYVIMRLENAQLIVEPTDEMIAGLTPENVTSDDLDDVEEALAMVENADYTDETLEALREKSEALMEAVYEALEAVETENVNDTLEVTPENVIPEDEDVLESAKEELEEVLETYEGNFTEEEKKVIRQNITRIDAALAVLERVEAVSDLLSALPQQDDGSEETAAKIDAAKRAYAALSDREKTLLPGILVNRLTDLLDEETEYAIIKGNGTAWTRDSGKPFSFTADGPMEKFLMLVIDKKHVTLDHYDAKSGSTIITVKESFMKTLANGDHTMTVIYTNGSAEGTFSVYNTAADVPTEKPDGSTGEDTAAKPSVPATGDDSHVVLYSVLLVVSVAAIAVLLMCVKKRKQENA